jgi:hypothetical protein
VTPTFSAWVRTDWRRRRGSLLALTLLVGVAAGGVMTAAAGARRTATSLERLADASSSADVLVDVGDGGIGAATAIGGLPSVSASAALTIVFAVVDGVDPGIDLGLMLPRSEVGAGTVERDVLVRGRRPDPTARFEVVVNEPMTEITGVDVGDRLVIRTLTSAQVQAEDYGTPRGPVLQVTVSGVTRGPADLGGRPEGTITATPALYPEVVGADEFATFVAVQLRAGATVATFQEDLAALAPTRSPLDVLSFSTRTQPARHTIATLARGLAVLAAVIAAVALATIGLAVARHLQGAARDDSTMRALGMVRHQRERALAATVLPVAVGGPAVAVVLAAICSPLTPIGLARRAEPDPGVRLDAPVLLVGAVGAAAVVAVVAAAGAAWAVRAERRPAPQRPSTAAAAAARLGAPAPVVNGIALALDRRTRGVPVRSTLAGLAVCAMAAIASTTFAAGLHRLAVSPERWGSPWDLSLDLTSNDVDATAQQLAADDTLTAVGRWDSGAVLADGSYVRGFALEPVRGVLGFSLVEGRQPGAGEVVVGPETADRGGVGVGGTVHLAPPGGEGREGQLRVAGIAVFPEIDDGDFDDAVGMTTEDFATYATVPDLFEASQLVVRVRPGVSIADTEARLRTQLGSALDQARPVRPGAVTNLAGLLSIPRLLVAFSAVLGLVVLAHAVRTAAERHAPDFATLRAIGMTRRQLWTCSLSQAVALVVAALVVGLPLGIASGRRTWSAVARSIDVAPDALVPAAAVATLAVGALLLAGVAGALVRRPPSAVDERQ